MNNKCFIFDIGKVMIDFHQENFQRMIAKSCNGSFDVISANWSNEVQLAIEIGQAEDQEYFDYYKEIYGLNWTPEEWVENYAAIYSLNKVGRDLFFELKGQGYPIYILSNLAEYNKLAIDVKFPGFLEESTRNFYSYELGFHKPDLEIYKTVCAEIGANPEDCFFLDDAEKNVEGAKEIGMNAVLYHENNIEEIKEKIQEFINN